MDIQDVIDDFDKFKNMHEQCAEILQDEKLYDEIFKKTKNELIKKFLLENKLICINDEKTNFVYLNHHTDKTNLIQELKKISINTIVDGKTILDNSIECHINRLGEAEFETKQLDYIIFLLESGSKPNLNIFIDYISTIRDENQIQLLMLVELMYLYGGTKPINKKMDDKVYK